jgi:Uma2 family endonuclease
MAAPVVVPASNPEPASRARMTYEEFLANPSIAHAEWVDGEVVSMPSVSEIHQQLTLFLLRLLADFLDVRGGLGVVRYEPFQMRLPERPSGRAPDLMVILNANRGRIRETYLDGPADIVIEVVSPGSAGTDRGDKFYEYEAGGVPEYWLIDPVRQVAEFYVRDERNYFTAAALADGVFASAVLPAFRLDPKWLWEQRPLAAVEAELGLR